jgi:hypothetical protein
MNFQTFGLDLDFATLATLLQFFKESKQAPTRKSLTTFFHQQAQAKNRKFRSIAFGDRLWQKCLAFDYLCEAWKAYHYPWKTYTYERKPIIELVRMRPEERACWALSNRQMMDYEEFGVLT